MPAPPPRATVNLAFPARRPTVLKAHRHRPRRGRGLPSYASSSRAASAPTFSSTRSQTRRIYSCTRLWRRQPLGLASSVLQALLQCRRPSVTASPFHRTRLQLHRTSDLASFVLTNLAVSFTCTRSCLNRGLGRRSHHSPNQGSGCRRISGCGGEGGFGDGGSGFGSVLQSALSAGPAAPCLRPSGAAAAAAAER